MSLDIPDQVRKTVIAGGNESWLDELSGVVDSLAQEWSLMTGASFAGGHAALVVEVTLADGTPAVLKIARAISAEGRSPRVTTKQRALCSVTAVISACLWRIRLSFIRIGHPRFAASSIQSVSETRSSAGTP